MYPFEKLETWHRAPRFAIACYRAVEPLKDFPLRSQVRRATISIAANIGEGASSQSQREFSRFLGIAIASGNEADYHLAFCADAGLIAPELVAPRRADLHEILLMLQGLRKAVRRNGGQRKTGAGC